MRAGAVVVARFVELSCIGSNPTNLVKHVSIICIFLLKA